MESMLIVLTYLFGFLIVILPVLIGLSFINSLREKYPIVGWLHRKLVLLLVAFIVVSAFWAVASVWKEFKSKERSSGTPTSQMLPGSTPQIAFSPPDTGKRAEIETVLVMSPPDTVKDTLRIVDTITVASPPDTVLLPGSTQIVTEQIQPETTRVISLQLMAKDGSVSSESALVEIECTSEVTRKMILVPANVQTKIPTHTVNVTVRVSGNKDFERLERTNTFYQDGENTWTIKLIPKGHH
jgi:hypothetical protein